MGIKKRIHEKIHDVLLRELVKKDDKGEYQNLMRLVGHGKFTVKLNVDLRNGKGNVDVVLTYPTVVGPAEGGGIFAAYSHAPIAFELVTGVDFDFGKKQEQLNRYKREYRDTRVIIPEEYKENYAELFSINNITVHTWKGTRRWKCENKKCENITEAKESSMKPTECSSKSCTSKEFHFIDLKDVQFK